MSDDVSRRDFLRGFHKMFGKRLASVAKTVTDTMRTETGPAAPRRVDLSLPALGDSIEGIPFVHPFMGIAWAIARRLDRPCPYVVLAGASGEAFRLGFRAGELAQGNRELPVNSFLSALALAGLRTRIMREGGEFPPALLEIEEELRAGRIPVVGGMSGPAVVSSLDRKNGRIRLVRPGGGPKPMPLVDFRDEWEHGGWTAGKAPFLRMSVEKGGSPRALDDIARVGLETMLMLLTREPAAPGAEGMKAWKAWADAVRDGDLDEDEAELLHGDFLIRHGVGRLIAGQLMLEIVRALPTEHREPLEEASRCYREIHNASPTGDVWGTGLFPEVAQCVQTDDRPDPEKYRDPALRTRAADLLEEIGAQEETAIEQVRSLPEEWRSLS